MNVECWLYVVICFRFVLGRQVRAFCCFYDRKNVVGCGVETKKVEKKTADILPTFNCNCIALKSIILLRILLFNV